MDRMNFIKRLKFNVKPRTHKETELTLEDQAKDLTQQLQVYFVNLPLVNPLEKK